MFPFDPSWKHQKTEGFLQGVSNRKIGQKWAKRVTKSDLLIYYYLVVVGKHELLWDLFSCKKNIFN